MVWFGTWALGALLAAPLLVLAGPYAPAVGSSGSTAISANDGRIDGWATGAVIQRGPQQFGDDDLGDASFGSEADALGPANATPGTPTPVVSLGDGGSATLSFNITIGDGPGFDFAVFENSFNDTYLELAFVEVSSDGEHWLRFPSISLTQTDSQLNGDAALGPLGAVDPTNLQNLAGKYRAGYGTPFDLADLRQLPNASFLSFSAVNYIRIIDVIGSIDPLIGQRDSLGNLINDPWATPYQTSGFDLDGVAVLNQLPEPTGALLFLLGGLLITTRRRQR